MLFTSKNPLQTDHAGVAVLDWQAEGDKFKIVHAQDVSSTIQSNHYEALDDNNGWSKDKTMRKIASVPDVVFLKHPEFLADTTGKSLIRWLRSDEGRPYRTVRKGI